MTCSCSGTLGRIFPTRRFSPTYRNCIFESLAVTHDCVVFPEARLECDLVLFNHPGVCVDGYHGYIQLFHMPTNRLNTVTYHDYRSGGPTTATANWGRWAEHL